MSVVTVMIVDDDKLLRYGLQRILETAPDIRVAVVCDGGEAVAMAEKHTPDVALVDIQMPDVDGFAVLAALRGLAVAPAVAMLTGFGSDEHVVRALSEGAVGFFLKDASPHELIPGVRLLGAGGTALSSRVVRALTVNQEPGFRSGNSAASEFVSPRSSRGVLTSRERTVFELLPTGMTNSEIARRLSLSSSTVKDHVSAILAKLGVANRVQAAVAAHHGVPGAGPDGAEWDSRT
ncbi:DNA-binding response regulator [Streptomyces spiroverticillatus]|uniref:DNA-binding response regulator n=1 Tax=Streptomyces finlayi TaxID=67296 RepID=A0A919CCT3_9ACTN|nr:response regulator transcription factor [Streptomyces finlayi]GHA23984.1 DNA-binding response regulator [Streptomyces spiroverticillatus]GHD06152.1 DNA-binding response regulator [Streptomyces finlayi]